MPAPNKHKAKASLEWRKKKGMVQPTLTARQKEKENLKKLDSNWHGDYDLPNADSDDEEHGELIGRTIDEFAASAKTSSAFTTNYANSAFTLNIGVPLRLDRFEVALADLDYLRLMGLTPKGK